MASSITVDRCLYIQLYQYEMHGITFSRFHSPVAALDDFEQMKLLPAHLPSYIQIYLAGSRRLDSFR